MLYYDAQTYTCIPRIRTSTGNYMVEENKDMIWLFLGLVFAVWAVFAIRIGNVTTIDELMPEEVSNDE